MKFGGLQQLILQKCADICAPQHSLTPLCDFTCLPRLLSSEKISALDLLHMWHPIRVRVAAIKFKMS